MVLQILSGQLTDTAISTWFDECEPVDIDGSRMVLKLNNDFKRGIVESRFSDMIKQALSEIFS